MVKIMTTGGVFCYDIDAPVGEGKGGMQADVELVRFGIQCMRKYAVANGYIGKPAYGEFLTLAVTISSTGPCDGHLIGAIRAFQKSQGSKVDGVVSPMNGKHHGASGKRLTLSHLLAAIRVETDNDFPRIDKHKDCGAGLGLAVQKLMHVKNSSMQMELK